MRCVRFTEPGGPEVIQIGDVADPRPSANEVLVRVRAAGVNRADLLQRKGLYPPPPGAPPDIPGLEFAGEIEALGDKVFGWSIGDRVMGISAGGAQAQRLAVHHRMLVRIPNALGFEEAAALPEAFITAHDALVTQAGFRAGEAVLIQAVASGVGTAALQLVRAGGGTSIGTSRSKDKLTRAIGLGLNQAIQVGPDRRFSAEVLTLTEGRGADVILDFVGSPYISENVESLAESGRLVWIGTLGGAEGSLDLGAVMRKRLRLFGTMLRARPIEEKILASQAFAKEVVPLLVRGLVRPVLDRAFPMVEVRQAHEQLERDQTFGKLVLQIE
jgi:putative PIG3 family NAD(P)H quinone oxidoreductase